MLSSKAVLLAGPSKRFLKNESARFICETALNFNKRTFTEKSFLDTQRMRTKYRNQPELDGEKANESLIKTDLPEEKMIYETDYIDSHEALFFKTEESTSPETELADTTEKEMERDIFDSKTNVFQQKIVETDVFNPFGAYKNSTASAYTKLNQLSQKILASEAKQPKKDPFDIYDVDPFGKEAVQQFKKSLKPRNVTSKELAESKKYSPSEETEKVYKDMQEQAGIVAPLSSEERKTVGFDGFSSTEENQNVYLKKVEQYVYDTHRLTKEMSTYQGCILPIITNSEKTDKDFNFLLKEAESGTLPPGLTGQELEDKLRVGRLDSAVHVWAKVTADQMREQKRATYNLKHKRQIFDEEEMFRNLPGEAHFLEEQNMDLLYREYESVYGAEQMQSEYIVAQAVEVVDRAKMEIFAGEIDTALETCVKAHLHARKSDEPYDRNYIDLLYEIAQIYIKFGKFESAIEPLEECIRKKVDPKFDEIQIKRGEELKRLLLEGQKVKGDAAHHKYMAQLQEAASYPLEVPPEPQPGFEKVSVRDLSMDFDLGFLRMVYSLVDVYMELAMYDHIPRVLDSTNRFIAKLPMGNIPYKTAARRMQLAINTKDIEAAEQEYKKFRKFAQEEEKNDPLFFNRYLLMYHQAKEFDFDTYDILIRMQATLEQEIEDRFLGIHRYRSNFYEAVKENVSESKRLIDKRIKKMTDELKPAIDRKKEAVQQRAPMSELGMALENPMYSKEDLEKYKSSGPAVDELTAKIIEQLESEFGHMETMLFTMTMLGHNKEQWDEEKIVQQKLIIDTQDEIDYLTKLQILLLDIYYEQARRNAIDRQDVVSAVTCLNEATALISDWFLDPQDKVIIETKINDSIDRYCKDNPSSTSKDVQSNFLSGDISPEELGIDPADHQQYLRAQRVPDGVPHDFTGQVEKGIIECLQLRFLLHSIPLDDKDSLEEVHKRNEETITYLKRSELRPFIESNRQRLETYFSLIADQIQLKFDLKMYKGAMELIDFFKEEEERFSVDLRPEQIAIKLPRLTKTVGRGAELAALDCKIKLLELSQVATRLQEHKEELEATTVKTASQEEDLQVLTVDLENIETEMEDLAAENEKSQRVANREWRAMIEFREKELLVKGMAQQKVAIEDKQSYLERRGVLKKRAQLLEEQGERITTSRVQAARDNKELSNENLLKLIVNVFQSNPEITEYFIVKNISVDRNDGTILYLGENEEFGKWVQFCALRPKSTSTESEMQSIDIPLTPFNIFSHLRGETSMLAKVNYQNKYETSMHLNSHREQEEEEGGGENESPLNNDTSVRSAYILVSVEFRSGVYLGKTVEALGCLEREIPGFKLLFNCDRPEVRPISFEVDEELL